MRNVLPVVAKAGVMGGRRHLYLFSGAQNSSRPDARNPAQWMHFGRGSDSCGER